jgi:hypothetical protein
MVFQKYVSDLADLIGLCFAALTLQIDLLFNPGFPKDVMAASNSHVKTQVQEQLAEVIKSDGSIRGPAQHSPQRLARAHADILHQDHLEE